MLSGPCPACRIAGRSKVGGSAVITLGFSSVNVNEVCGLIQGRLARLVGYQARESKMGNWTGRGGEEAELV